MSARDPGDIEEELLQAAKEMEAFETANDVREWWGKHYTKLGHRRLGRLLIGQNVERLLERSIRGTSE
jgi:predicted NAD-dependent protein-ADP-ribosyltransferase YbiA (DUF1768 family)